MHRMIFLWHYGFLPQIVDHSNGIRNDNRIENLRAADPSKNSQNSRRRSGNILFKGVGACKKTGRFRAKIKKSGKQIHIGYFSTAEEAARAYDEKAKEIFGDFCRTNFP